MQVLKIAQERNDTEVVLRMRSIPNGDLTSVQARYHRKKGCLASYLRLGKRRIQTEMPSKTSCFTLTTAIASLKDEYKQQIIDERKIVPLSKMKTRFIEILNDIEKENFKSSYGSALFKIQLKREWPDVDFYPQSGPLSDLVCASDMSVGEAVRKANGLDRKTMSCVNYSLSKDINERETQVSDEVILHKAAGVLRPVMKHTSRLESEYYSSDEMTLHAQKQFVQPLLVKFLSGLTNEKAFKQACDAQAEVDLRLLASACDITTLATSIFSPKHLGLAIHLHHEFGSRKLIDDLSSLGHCVSYDELRQFKTSAAEHIYGEQIITPSGAVIPPDIATRADGGQLIVGAGDNWDHNERTPDGKNTTHAMTTILVSPMVSNQVSYPRIKVSSSRTLKKQPDLSEVLPYQKPSHRPEPRLTGQVVSDSLIVRPTVNIEKAQMTEFAFWVIWVEGDEHIIPMLERLQRIFEDR